MLAFDQAWLQRLRDSANVPTLLPRLPLWAGEAVIGSLEPGFLDQIMSLRYSSGDGLILKVGQEQNNAQEPLPAGVRVLGDLTSSLNRIAALMRQAGLAGAWRNEQLAVRDQQGLQLGTIERAAVRPLGIRTLAVHLVGRAPDGRFWVQQRAFDKPNDLGLWDTLMGGMVACSDSAESALARETWEEAGLNVSDLQDLSYGGRLSTARPSADGAAAYLQEDTDWYCCTVPDALVPESQDGEVEQFRLMTPAQLLAALQRGEFTLEATLILAEVLGLE